MEFLALHDGMLQRVTTAGEELVLRGEPFRERLDPRARSGVPAGLITAQRVPCNCTCSWAYAAGLLTLKYCNTACPLLAEHKPGAS
ncbi:MAG TPA: hypothetical protein VFW16_02650 [Streptosporangiaceae bacterium]|nr:hypothetical protein [Streptosporangiaceae bacterium]